MLLYFLVPDYFSITAPLSDPPHHHHHHHPHHHSVLWTPQQFCFLVCFCYFVFCLFWPHCTACKISVPQPGIEPGPRQWKPRILTTRPPGDPLLNSFKLLEFSELSVSPLQLMFFVWVFFYSTMPFLSLSLPGKFLAIFQDVTQISSMRNF